MKIHNQIKIAVILLFIALQTIVIGQNQSMLLPISGDTYPISTGSKMINFTDPSNSDITTLPKHVFYIDINQTILGDPHNENHLSLAQPLNSDNLYLFNEKYLGQHPMYAQNIVHDADGNLLFFIVDNNIYNQDGEAFIYEGSPVPCVFSYLHDGEIEYGGNSWCVDGSTINRITLSNYLLDPEIVVFPIYGECYKYGLVYSFFDSNAHYNASTVFYRTLTYIDKKNIILSKQVLISEYFSEQMSCNEESNRNIAISEYRKEHGNYLLFVRFYNSLEIFTIDGTGVIDVDNFEDIVIVDDINPPHNFSQFSSEMEVIKP